MNTNRVSDKWNLNLRSFASRLISSEVFLNKLNEHLQGQHTREQLKRQEYYLQRHSFI